MSKPKINDYDLKTVVKMFYNRRISKPKTGSRHQKHNLKYVIICNLQQQAYNLLLNPIFISISTNLKHLTPTIPTTSQVHFQS